MNARSALRLSVFKGEICVGELARTAHGASFQYSAEYVAEPVARRPDLAFSLPVRTEPYEVFGANLHPFFAGLLPEGLRLRALVRGLKTSEDDLFSLLAASAADAVGDVSVSSSREPPLEHAPIADIQRLHELSFEQLFQESLRHDLPRPEAAIAGVQPKLSAAMISFPLRAAHKRRAYILKVTPSEYPQLSENEAFFMRLTRRCGIDVAATELVHDKDKRSGLLVQRFDRVPRADGSFERLHQEDACQLLDRYPADKYRVTLAEIGQALEVCSAPVPERLKLLRLQALAYLIGNGDMHAKNISVYTAGKHVTLTPAYDILSTLPYGDRSLALSMEGRDDKLKAAHFVAAGTRLGLPPLAVEQMLRGLSKKVALALPELGEIGLPEKKTAHLAKVMHARLADLSV